MKPILRLALISLVASCMMLVAVPRPAAAHPLGNFTVNQYSALTIGTDQVDLFYVVDMAEIPAFQELGTISSDHGTDLTQAERDAYISKKSAELAKGLALTIDGKALQLTVTKTDLSFPPGAGGLPTLRIEMSLMASLEGVEKGSLRYQDANFTERIGWKEIIANAGEGMTLAQSSVPTTDRSEALRKYSSDLASNPPTVQSATLTFALGAVAAGTAPKQAQTEQSKSISSTSWAQGRADALTDLIAQKELSLGALLIGLVIAFVFGAGHALGPGHGKTVVAAYLVGSRGTAAHAALLGITVTISHTIGVFLLGLVVLFAADYILPEKVYPWLGFASGFLIAALGVVLFLQRRRTFRSSNAQAQGSAMAGHSHDEHSHDHVHDHHSHEEHEHTYNAHTHTHDYDPSHDHEHEHHNHEHDASTLHKHGLFSRPHTHVPADGQKVTLGSLLALGITGGIIPCPSALVVLLVAVASHRVALGLLLILAFSLGLAVVLTGIGLLMVYSRGLLGRVRFNTGLLGKLPMASALAVTCLGLLLAYGSLSQGGVLR